MQVNSYPLQHTSLPQKVSLPLGAKPVSVAVHNGQLTLFALVGPSAREEERTICLAFTGQPLPPGAIKAFLGTVEWPVMAQQLAVHAFEL